ncbi:hypothetical protein [Wohlfahrtiimonas chitiniclastica]|uniref:hypothetical protein n=1 Tax=Wohlfahrtiimonas chitiniclastica TaxID=400946 RepID=UPI0007B69AC4|nr:hypothetical protein [Wohlfahrtiimonas chitiniclastica]KZX37249.1 hypothetical protein A6V30_10210 [Wohlfahrtiimonas chitiniclastica]KZX37269.1 hypothetical protein A6V30_10315 [Wohlfahrtiimonas chitiniclastica]
MNEDLKKFCELYNLPINHLGEILKDPKVIPMIRGKAFEFSVLDLLSSILDSRTWHVSKPFLNPQLGSNDQDVLIVHLTTGKNISIECKLSAKGKYSYKDQKSIFSIKCMRSRTLGAELVKKLAPIKGVSEESLEVHNDQYLPEDFDLVVTSLANAFYSTNDDGIFIWDPSYAGREFLSKKYGAGLSDIQYQALAFNDMYVAKSSDICINQNNNIICTRRKCTNNKNCGFVPNYPQLIFSDINKEPKPWISILNIEELLLDLI